MSHTPLHAALSEGADPIPVADDVQQKHHVYVITNRINGKQYVGKTNDTKDRWYKHRYVSLRGSCCVLHRAMRKHGAENFTFEVLNSYVSEKEALEAETAAILHLKSTTAFGGYNSNEGGRGGTRPSEEVRSKMREAQLGHSVTPEARQKISKARTGSKHSDAAKLKMSVAKAGKPKSAETRARMSAAWLGHKVSAETGRKIAEANRGRKVSEATRKKMSIARKGKPKGFDHRRKIGEANRGRTISQENQDKMQLGYRAWREASVQSKNIEDPKDA